MKLRPVELLLLVTTSFLIGALSATAAIERKPVEPNLERATFMLECVNGWNLSNETCERILYGEPVPELEEVEVGC